jgi:hypothetical protein
LGCKPPENGSRIDKDAESAGKSSGERSRRLVTNRAFLALQKDRDVDASTSLSLFPEYPAFDSRGAAF